MDANLGAFDALGSVPLQGALEHTGVGLAACNAAGRLTLVSPALQRMLGYPVEPARGDRHVGEVPLLTEDASRQLSIDELPITRALTGEFVRDVVVTSRQSDGGLVHLRCNAAPLHNEVGKPCGALVLVQDITIEREAHRKRDELIDRLVTTINHEFRTPLAALLGNVELMRDHLAELPADFSDALDATERAGWRLSVLVSAVAEMVERAERLHGQGLAADGSPCSA